MPVSADDYRQLLALAPDTLTLEQARGIFFSKGWLQLAGDGQWLWGEYETRYGQHYQTAVRLAPPAFRCNCKATRRPCKHALGLLLLFLNPDDRWQTGLSQPDWLAAQATPPKPAPAPAAEPNREKRLELMDEGMAELEKWLLDLVKGGLAELPALGADLWHTFAARMVDYKLGAVARRIRLLQPVVGTPHWPDTVLSELGSLYLLARAWRRRHSLPEPARWELWQTAGLSLRREEVERLPPQTDHWLVLGQVEGQEEKLTYRRTWLRGEHSQRLAMILDFSFGQQGFDTHWITGSALHGNLVFYPGAFPLRALAQHMASSRDVYENLAGYDTLADMLDAFATALAQNPWLTVFPVLLNDLTLVVNAGQPHQILALDPSGHSLEVGGDETSLWKLLALGGGLPLQVFGEFDGKVLVPLSAVSAGRIVSLSTRAR